MFHLQTAKRVEGRNKDKIREQVGSAQVSSPFMTPWVLYIEKKGGGWQFAPEPLVGTTSANRSLGLYMRPIFYLGWVISPTLDLGSGYFRIALLTL